MQQQTAELREEGSFHGQDYIISVHFGEARLSLTVESKLDAQWWQNSFTSGYLEELSTKAGGKMNMNQFCQAVIRGLKLREVYKNNFDILSFEDLQALRNSQNTSSSQVPIGSYKKRYVIVTATIDGINEPINYPLSLLSVGDDNPQFLKDTLRRMKLETDELKSKSIRSNNTLTSKYSSMSSTSQGKQSSNAWTQPKDLASLKSENEMLMTKMARISLTSASIRSSASASTSHDTLAAVKEQLQAELINTKAQTAKTIERLHEQITAKEQELLATQVQFTETCRTLAHTSVIEPQSIQRIRQYLERLSNQMSEDTGYHRKVIANQSAALEQTLKEVEFYRVSEKRQRFRINQLEIELHSTSFRTAGERYSSPFNRPLTASSAKNSPSNRRATSAPSSKSPSLRSSVGSNMFISKNSRVVSSAGSRNSSVSKASQVVRGGGSNFTMAAVVYGNNQRRSTSSISPGIFRGISGTAVNRASPLRSKTQRDVASVSQKQQNIFNRVPMISNQPKKETSLHRIQNNHQSSRKISNQYGLLTTDQNLLARIDLAARQANQLKPKYSDAQLLESYKRQPMRYQSQQEDRKISNFEHLLYQ